MRTRSSDMIRTPSSSPPWASMVKNLAALRAFIMPPAPGRQARRTSARPKTSSVVPTRIGIAKRLSASGAIPGAPGRSGGVLVNVATRCSTSSGMPTQRLSIRHLLLLPHSDCRLTSERGNRTYVPVRFLGSTSITPAEKRGVFQKEGTFPGSQDSLQGDAAGSELQFSKEEAMHSHFVWSASRLRQTVEHRHPEAPLVKSTATRFVTWGLVYPAASLPAGS